MRTTNRSFKQVTEKEFNQLKALLNLKVKKVKLTQVYGRSSGTLKRVDRAENYEGYKTLLTEFGAKYKNRKKLTVESTQPTVKIGRQTVFSDDVIVEALKAVKNGSDPIKVARNIPVPTTTLYRWCRKAGVKIQARKHPKCFKRDWGAIRSQL